jgi:hypothetical protein
MIQFGEMKKKEQDKIRNQINRKLKIRQQMRDL